VTAVLPCGITQYLKVCILYDTQCGPSKSGLNSKIVFNKRAFVDFVYMIVI